MSLRNKYSYDHADIDAESYKEPSMTVSGQVSSIQDILEQYAHGKLPEERGNAVYFDEEDLSKVNKFFAPHRLDLTDLDKLNSDVDRMRDAVKEAMDRKAKADEKKRQYDAFKKQLDDNVNEQVDESD